MVCSDENGNVSGLAFINHQASTANHQCEKGSAEMKQIVPAIFKETTTGDIIVF